MFWFWLIYWISAAITAVNAAYFAKKELNKSGYLTRKEVVLYAVGGIFSASIPLVNAIAATLGIWTMVEDWLNSPSMRKVAMRK